MMTLVIFALLSTALYYLGSRALITRWLWSRYPSAIAHFMDCAACSGFWYGFFLSLAYGDEHAFDGALTLPSNQVLRAFMTSSIVGLCMLVLTPLVAGLMQYALVIVGSAVDEEKETK